jgi:glutamyl-Q tRNA(Asp) synthetase
MIVTRFAPSPTGYLHLGHAYAALMAARAGRRFLLRIEDLDLGRAREEFAAAIFEDLAWLGLHWEEPVLRQSARMHAYRRALDALTAMDLTYPCFCTRKEIADEIARAAEAPHFDVLSAPHSFDLAAPLPGAGPDGPLYPGTCRHLSESERRDRIASGAVYALRLDAGKAAKRAGPLTFREKNQIVPVDPLKFGDPVLARKDVPAAYHLAVVVDDAFQGVNLVTRGEDLLPAAHIQRLLQALLSLPEPAYAHHRLILDGHGRKFSKRDQAVTLRALRAAGATPREIYAQLGL